METQNTQSAEAPTQTPMLDSATVQSGDAPIAQTARQKAMAYKEANSGQDTTVLPETQIGVMWDKFASHEVTLRAQKLAGADRSEVASILLATRCTFEGEHFTVDEINTILPSGDVAHLMNRVINGKPENSEGEPEKN